VYGKKIPEHKIYLSGFRYAMSLSHHREDAEDFVQQAWLKLCKTATGVWQRYRQKRCILPICM